MKQTMLKYLYAIKHYAQITTKGQLALYNKKVDFLDAKLIDETDGSEGQ